MDLQTFLLSKDFFKTVLYMLDMEYFSQGHQNVLLAYIEKIVVEGGAWIPFFVLQLSQSKPLFTAVNTMWKGPKNKEEGAPHMHTQVVL